jgi:hypothetical protein
LIGDCSLENPSGGIAVRKKAKAESITREKRGTRDDKFDKCARFWHQKDI